jgi:hypothetical protein
MVKERCARSYIPMHERFGDVRRLFFLGFLGVVALAPLFFPGGPARVAMAQTPEDDLETSLALMRESLEIIDTIYDYQAILYKHDRVNGKLFPEEKIFMKWMAPQYIYMRFEQGEQKGQELIYVRGRNDDLMTVSPGGAMGMMTLDIAPDSDMALKKNRHTVPEVGIGPNLTQALTTLEADFDNPASTVWVEYADSVIFHGDECYLIRMHESSYAALSEVYIYRDTKLPAAFISSDESGELLESYRYVDIQTNVGLDESDFDPDNEVYDF